MTFEHLTAEPDGKIYGVQSGEDARKLLFYEYLHVHEDNTAELQFGPSFWRGGVQIARVDADLVCFFSGASGVLYGIDWKGVIYFYKDPKRDGTPMTGEAKKIGKIKPGFRDAFSGGGGVIYVVDDAGDILFYQDEAQDGTPDKFSNDGAGQKIGSMPRGISRLISGGAGRMYGIAEDGALYFFRDEAGNGSVKWTDQGIGKKIDDGWGNLRYAFSDGAGVIYSVDNQDFLVLSTILDQNGQAKGGTVRRRKIGQGWAISPRTFCIAP